MASMVESALAPAQQRPQIPLGQVPQASPVARPVAAMPSYQPAPSAPLPFQGYQPPQLQHTAPYGAPGPQYGGGYDQQQFQQPQPSGMGFAGYNQQSQPYGLGYPPQFGGQPFQPGYQGGYQPPQFQGYPQPNPMGFQQPQFQNFSQQRMQQAQQPTNPVANALAPNPQAAPMRPLMAPAQQAQQAQQPVNPVANALVPRPLVAPMQPPMASQLAMSDRTQKTIEKKTLADAFLESLKPYSYKYKDKHMEPRVIPTGGTYLGVMAQDLEKVPEVGHQLVVDTPAGKMVDQKSALSAVMAGLGRMDERLRAVEEDLTRGTTRGRKPKVKRKE